MGKNPAFGMWSNDDSFPDQCHKVGNDHLNSRGPSAYLWDLRGNEKKIIPCTVTVGKFVIAGVIFPKKKKTAERINRLAENAIEKLGNKNHPVEYSIPKGVDRRMLPFYRYCLAKLLNSEKGLASCEARGDKPHRGNMGQ